MLYPPPKRKTGAQDTPATGGNEWLFYVIWGVVLAVTTLVVALFMEGVEGARNSVPTLLGVLGFGVLLLVCFWFNVVLHEAGHCIAGSMGGGVFISLPLGLCGLSVPPGGGVCAGISASRRLVALRLCCLKLGGSLPRRKM